MSPELGFQVTWDNSSFGDEWKINEHFPLDMKSTLPQSLLSVASVTGNSGVENCEKITPLQKPAAAAHEETWRNNDGPGID